MQNLKFIYQSMLPAISCFVDNFHVWPIEYQHPVALEETTKRSLIPEETRRASNEPFSVALPPLDADKLATGIPRAPFRPNKIKSLGEEEIFKENSRLVCSVETRFQGVNYKPRPLIRQRYAAGIYHSGLVERTWSRGGEGEMFERISTFLYGCKISELATFSRNNFYFNPEKIHRRGRQDSPRKKRIN